MQDITVGPNGIRLGQFLKFVNAVPTGGEVKALLESCDVSVNGKTEIRRGAQLDKGDVVAAHGSTWRIV